MECPEAVERGRNFRLLAEEELSKLLDFLTEYLPESLKVRPLKAEHAEGIHELYPANDMECHEIFLRLIRTLPAAGVFAKGSLAAWMVQSYYGAMFSMQTKPEYRRKGYGTKLVRYLTKRVAEKGYYPFVVIRPENEASQNLYKKLGFRRLYQLVRMIFTPFTWQESENDANILRGNLDNAVRQLTIEQRVITALHGGQERSEETIVRNPAGIAEDESIVDKSEKGEEIEEKLVETIEERSVERIDVADSTTKEDAPEVVEVNGSCDYETDAGSGGGGDN